LFTGKTPDFFGVRYLALPVKLYINNRQRLKELYAYGESIASKNNFSEEDVFNEIKEYRKNK